MADSTQPDQSTPVSQSFYWSGNPGGATSGLVLAPDFQNNGVKASTQDVQNHITQYSGGQYANDAWSQNYVQSLKSGLAQLQSGTPSGYVQNQTTGNLDTQTHINQEVQDKAAIAGGTATNVGTAAAPLLVPKGSAGAQAIQQNPAAAQQNTGTPYTPQNAQNYDKFQQGATAAKAAGTTSPTDATGANTMFNQFLPADQTSQGTNFVSQDPYINNAIGAFNQYMSTQNQQQSLATTYQSLLKSSGLQQTNTDLMNMQNVMNGTEDDIRTEITKADGFATNSQVLALTTARNKQLLTNYNTLLQTQKNQQDYVDNTMNFTEKDRANASTQLDTVMKFDQQMSTMSQQMHQSAVDTLNNTAKAIGWDGVYQATQGDPNLVSQIEKTYGLPAGGLAIAAQRDAQTRTQTLQTQALDNQYKQAQITAENKPISVSAGSTLYDPKTGKPIYTSPGSGGGRNTTISTPDGKTTSVPTVVAPYVSTSSSGVNYVDASTLQGTAAEKASIVNQAQAAGLKVITNKNMSADLVNIGDANSKLDYIGTIMQNIDQPSWISRDLYGLGLTKFAEMAQTDPQKAAAGALSSVGLDILKAISGVQGFRGNQTAVQQVKDHLPSIYDTNDTVKTKIQFIKGLISSRENSILGSSGTNSGGSTSTSHGGVTLPQGQSNSFNGVTLPH